MKRVMFIVLPSILTEDYSHTDQTSVWNQIAYPFGPLSIIAYVKKYFKKAIDFKILDLRPAYYQEKTNKSGQEKIAKLIETFLKDYKPDFIGLSALFDTCYAHMPIVDKVLQAYKNNAVVFIGGGFATISYKDILNEFSSVDIVTYAEGEIPTLKLLEAENPKFSYINNSAIISRESLLQGQEPKPQFIQNLDDIPIIDFSYIKFEEYKTQYANFMTSRGCPFNCVFCAAYMMVGKKIRYYSQARVAEDLKRYYSLGFRNFNIFDDNFFFDKDRAKSILKTIIELNLNNDILLNFPSGVMVANITEDIAQYLPKAGVKEISLALESGSERVLREIINKPVTKKAFERAINALKKYNIKTRVFIVTGLPGETDEDRAETVRYLKQVGINWASINIAVPLFGSRLYKICKENNYIKNFELKKFKMGEAYIETPEYSAGHIKYQAYLMNLDINFINNYDMLQGNYKYIIPIFEHIANSYSHAFANYCLAKCFKAINKPQLAKKHYKQYIDIINKDETSLKYANYFNLPLKEEYYDKLV